MSTQDFQKICDVYPTFKDRIMEVVKKRNMQNKATIHKIVQQSIIITGDHQAIIQSRTSNLKSLKNLEYSSSSEESDDSESQEGSGDPGKSSRASQSAPGSETHGPSKDAKRLQHDNAFENKESKCTSTGVPQADSTAAGQAQEITQSLDQLSSSRSKSPIS